MTHAEIFIAIGCSFHGELEDGVKGIVEGGLLEGFVHDEVEVIGRAGGVGLESLFEALLAAAEGEEQEGGEEDEKVFHIVGDIMGSHRWLRRGLWGWVCNQGWLRRGTRWARDRI
jgi:hypothetical protein